MKAKIILGLVLLLALVAGLYEVVTRPAMVAGEPGARKALYYTCAMHPWVREKKPGPCPVCGMNLTPVYDSGAGSMTVTNSSMAETNSDEQTGLVRLEPDSISTINVQTDMVTNLPIRRTLHLSGEITGNSSQNSWFEFTAYQRDLQWLKTGQTLEVFVADGPDKTYTARIKAHGTKPFADRQFDMIASSTTVRAEISNGPVSAGEFSQHRDFDGLHAEAHLVAETEPVPAIPRSAIISRGMGDVVYVDQGDGHYLPRRVELGRIGDKLAEVLGGVNVGDKVVTSGNVLIDSEAQLTTGQ